MREDSGQTEQPGAPAPSGPSMPSTPTHVVTCFLVRQDRGRDEVLLVRRSERVRTYRGHWAGVSGYVEPGIAPETQAHTEIAEETGLTGDDIVLLRRGAPLPVADAAQGLSWVVHPFLFQVRHPARVHTDWEARDAQWVAPAALGGYLTVPGLAEALARVYPPHELNETAETGGG
ncbi:MAG TPA: NUDIX pyrophosphatase [Ktedonobacterales bacterium]|jgi:ADP-ribose pyrophosphatase YjhB (NUDIX family)